MKALAVLAFVLGVVALIFPSAQEREASNNARERAVATNYVLFREATMLHVFATRPSGDIPQSALNLPTGWVALRAWRARVESGHCLIWGPASLGEIAATRELLHGSLAVGRAQGGLLVPGYGAKVPVPGVPDGSLVSVMSLD